MEEQLQKPRRDTRISVTRLPSDLTGRISICFYQDDPDNGRHEFSGTCGWMWGALDRWWTRLTLWWITERGVNYGHVEMMFSDGTVVSATRKGGVHVETDKVLSNDGYQRFLQVRVSKAAEELMLEKAKSHKGKPFNSFGQTWNHIKPLRGVALIDKKEEAFYCSELVTYLLKIGGEHDKSGLCATLDHRTTNPTQLFLYLFDSNRGKLSYNKKETALSGKASTESTGMLTKYLMSSGRKKKASGSVSQTKLL